MRAAVCGRVLSCRSTTPDVNIPLLSYSMALRSFFRVSQYVSDVIVVPGSINDQQHSFSVPEHCCHHLSVCQRLFEFPGFIR